MSKFLSSQRTFGRSVGFITISLVAHAAALSTVLISPSALNDFGSPEGNGGESAIIDLQAPGTGSPTEGSNVQDPAAAAEAAALPVEVLTTNDIAAVPLPAKEPVAPPAPKPAPMPEKKPVAKPEPKPEKPAPKVVVKEPAKPVQPKPAQAKKVVSQPAPETMEDDESEVKVETASTEDTTSDTSVKEAPVTEEKEQESTEDEESVRPVALAPPPKKVQPSPQPTEPEPEQQEESEPEVKVVTATTPAPAPASTPVPAPAPPAPPKVVEAEPAKEAAPPVSALVSRGGSPTANSSPTDTTKALGQNTAPASAQASGGSSFGGQGGTGTSPGSGGTSGQQPGGFGIPAGAQIRDADLRRPMAGNTNPVYPQQDRFLRREGTVVVVAKVMADGSISEVHLRRSSGSKLMDQSALQTFKGWKYQPGREEYLQKAFVFSLKGDPIAVPTRLGHN